MTAAAPPPPSMFDIVGGIAAAAALGGAIYGLAAWGYRAYRRRKLLAELKKETREIRRLDELLRKTTWDMEQLFSKGFPWAGYAIFIGEMGDHLNTLQGIAGETGDVMARVRALEADGADERLRSDVERIADGLRRVTPLYIWGIVQSYRTAGTTAITAAHPPNDDDDVPSGEIADDLESDQTTERDAEDEEWAPLMVQIPPSATGREPTRTLKYEDRAKVRDLRLALRVLFRSVASRLQMDDLKNVPFAAWPIDMAEAYHEEAKLRSHLTIPYEH
jgi:hypothetical protein